MSVISTQGELEALGLVALFGVYRQSIAEFHRAEGREEGGSEAPGFTQVTELEVTRSHEGVTDIVEECQPVRGGRGPSLAEGWQHELVLRIEHGAAADGVATDGVGGTQRAGRPAAHRVRTAYEEVLEWRVQRGLAVRRADAHLPVKRIDELEGQRQERVLLIAEDVVLHIPARDGGGEAE